MHEMIQKNKTVIRFLAIFLITYVALTVLYRWYLGAENVIDVYTQWVSDHAVGVLHFFNEPITDTLQGNAVAVYEGNTIVAYISEGCNAMTLQILFVAFILAFARKWKLTLLYILFGWVFIYIVNIVRIALFIMLLRKFPVYTAFLHDIFFPAIIYGVVFLLWMNWIRLFQKQKVNG